jgi:para-nitrobenzyl esterase
MQPGLPSDGFAPPLSMSEDCLYLNVWTTAAPDTAAAPFPVLVWLHGGAYLIGSGHDIDMSRLARRGVVVVAMNYRLGVLGFLGHPELSAEGAEGSSGNYGLMDQIAALHWIQANIAVFGGDPRRVTIAGASSGATSVNLLVVSALARGLFHGAIAQSGSAMPSTGFTDGSPLPRELEERKGVRFARSAGATGVDELRAIPAEALVEAAGSRWETWAWNASIDGWVVPAPPARILAAGLQNDVPLIAGWTANEGASLARAAFGDDDISFPERIRATFGAHAAEILRLYPGGSIASERRGKVALAGDGFIAFPMWSWVIEQLRTGSAPVFMYEFAQPPPVPANWARHPSMLGEPGAYHGASQPYLFEEFARYPLWLFTDADRRLGGVMASYWANFARAGDPNGSGLAHWTRYEPVPGAQKIRFLSGGANCVPDADLARLRALAPLFAQSPGALSYRSMQAG